MWSVWKVGYLGYSCIWRITLLNDNVMASLNIPTKNVKHKGVITTCEEIVSAWLTKLSISVFDEVCWRFVSVEDTLNIIIPFAR